MDSAVLSARADADTIDDFLIGRGIPTPLAQVIEDSVEEPLNRLLETWQDEVLEFTVQANIAQLTPAAIGDRVTSLLDAAKQAVLPEFEVWEPAIEHLVTSAAVFSTDDGWHNPALIVEQTRSEVVG